MNTPIRTRIVSAIASVAVTLILAQVVAASFMAPVDASAVASQAVQAPASALA
jgi:hypothetical protein